jgi:hypothetical protein
MTQLVEEDIPSDEYSPPKPSGRRQKPSRSKNDVKAGSKKEKPPEKEKVEVEANNVEIAEGIEVEKADSQESPKQDSPV